MLEVGLTGGIGSGKSTVATALAARGAVVIDADRIVRELQEPGRPVYREIVDHFGDDVVAADGSLDRRRLAAVVFADPEDLAALNAIVHPVAGAEIERQRTGLADSDAIVVYDIPLLVDAGGERKAHYAHLAAVMVVDCDPDTAVRRLVDLRGFDEADALSRIANQAPRAARLSHADFVIDNSGTLDDLTPQLDRCWTWLQSQT